MNGLASLPEGLGLLLAVAVGLWALRKRLVAPAVLGVLQAALLLYARAGGEGGGLLLPAWRVDGLALLLSGLTVGLGAAVAVYAAGYLPGHARHHAVRPRPARFFLLLFTFLGAMVGLSLANDLRWLHVFWEATTLCSALLIAHDGTDEAVRAAGKALVYNLGGGLVFTFALLGLARAGVEPYLSALPEAVRTAGPASGPFIQLALLGLAIAGLIKAAQFPFTDWLLGAMVAPAPVSALLHSATMVKAGVYLIFRLAPALAAARLTGGVTLAGGVAALGALTSAFASFAALGQRHAKRVLAYSTVANLGLMVMAAGIGTKAAVLAGLVLLGFHALSKALLFLASGSAEGAVGSYDLPAFEGLLRRAPLTGWSMAVGILSLLLPPFGVLVGKWLTLEAAATHPALLGLAVAGSAATVFFWVRWLGLVVTRPAAGTLPAAPPSRPEQVVLGVLSLGVVVFSFWIALRGGAGGLVPLAVLALAGLAMRWWGRAVVVRPPYLCGENAGRESFHSAGDQATAAVVGSHYLEHALDERRVRLLGIGCSLAVLAVLALWIGVTLA